MKKITSKKEQEKKQKRNQLIIGVVLVAIMFFSVFGYGFAVKDEDTSLKKVEYNGYEFIRINNLWITETENYYLSFLYSPEETPDIAIDVNNIQRYAQEVVYIDSVNELARAEIERNINPRYNNRIALRIQEACLNGTECLGDLPIKDCNNNLIVIKESNSTNITTKGRCVFIEGPEKELTKVTDEFLYRIFNIKE